MKFIIVIKNILRKVFKRKKRLTDEELRDKMKEIAKYKTDLETQIVNRYKNQPLKFK